MDDFLHAPLIPIDGACPVDALIAAQCIEQRRREAQIGPAVFADSPVQWMVERLPAPRARRLEER
jgi:hypothetical protein